MLVARHVEGYTEGVLGALVLLYGAEHRECLCITLLTQ